MSAFLNNPNLPEGNVYSLICGGLNADIIDYFERRGIELLYTEENKTVDKAVSKHADLSALYFGGGRIVVDRGQTKLISKLKALGFSVTETDEKVSGTYPGDCILNHTVMGENIIGNSKIFDESVKRLCKGLKAISVNQGYCKCSVLVVDERSIITDDESVARKVSENGIECLLISKGDIFLEGHSYGFIGGAGGKISKNEIIFFGDITKHRDYDRIKKFIAGKDMEIISFDFPLTDFGGIIPVKENIL